MNKYDDTDYQIEREESIEYEEASVYANKFAIMQKQIDEKEKKIKELEEALLKVKDKNTTLFITCRNSIPVQKVKEIVKEAIEIIESEQFKIIMGDMTKVGRLRWLLEIKLLEDK